MIDYLNELQDITKYLKDDLAYKDINFIKDTLNDKKFLLSFVGQFSSGKSRLINNILNKELLPVRILECTQVPTFIKYGEVEKAVIFKEDYTISEISISDVKEIWLGNKSDEFNNIAHIEIFMNNNVLKNGLVIADTPGINSTVDKHEKLTREILKSSEEVVYVLSKPVTYSDKLFLNEIIDKGLKVLCVRTYMDTIKSSEENINDAILHDRNLIKELGDDSVINIYHVSNESDNIWFEKIEALRKYISIDIAQNIDSKIEESCKLRLLITKEELKKQLENKKAILESVLKNNEGELNLQLRKIDEAMNNFERKLDKQKSNYSKNLKEVKAEAKRDLLENRDSIIRDIKNKIDNTSLFDGVEESIHKMLYKNLSDSTKILQYTYINPFDKFINDNSILIENEVKSILEGISIDYEVPMSIQELALTIEEEESESENLKRDILELSESIKEKEYKLESLKDRSKEYEEEKKAIYEAIKDIEVEIANHGSYECRYIENENNNVQPSEVLKRIGNGLDWATCLIPGKAYPNIASKLGKVLSVTGKTGKALKQADSIKDKLFALKNIKNVADKTRATKKRTEHVLKIANNVSNVSKKTGILDFANFEYWFEKAGKCFDKPILMEVDREYEREYNETKKMLTQKYSQLKNAEIDKLQKLGIIKNEDERINKIKEIEIRRNKILIDELSRKEKEMKILARQRAFEMMKKKYIYEFETLLDEVSRSIISQSDKYLELPLEQYYEKCVRNIKFEIKKQKEMQEEILNKYKSNGIKDIEESLVKCNEYFKVIKG